MGISKEEKALYDRNHRLKKIYGISYDEYIKMSEMRQGLCDICSRPCDIKPKLSVDHSHDTGKVRGLLCQKCNAAIGFFREDVEVMQKAINYLKGFL